MKLTKGRIHKLLLKEKQTRKCFKNKAPFKKHNISNKPKKQFNLKNHTLKHFSSI